MQANPRANGQAKRKRKRSQEKGLRKEGKRRVSAADKGLDLTALDFDPERFVDFYAQKGWMIGRSHMKDWKATVRNWVRTSKPKNGMAKEVPDDGFSAYD